MGLSSEFVPYGHCKVLTWWYAVQQRLLVLRRSSSGSGDLASTPDTDNVTANVSDTDMGDGWILYFIFSTEEKKTTILHYFQLCRLNL